MSTDTRRQPGLDDVLIVDEIGMESGCYGIYRLRSFYQPIFARMDGSLRVVAVEGTVAPCVAGEDVAPEVFLAAVAADDLDLVERMGLALPLRNHRNIGLGMLELVADPEGSDPQALIDRIRLVAGELDGAGLDPGLVVCALGEQAASGGPMLSRIAEEVRGHGMRIAVADFGAGHWTDEQVEMLRPEIVRIDGDWFRKVCRDTTTVRLFDAVVARLRERPSRVLVTGIEDGEQFGVALRAGAELFQGPYLAAPALVGTMLGEPLSIAEKLGDARKIVPLFG